MSPRPFTLSIITGQIPRGYQEEDDEDNECSTEGDGAEAADGTVGVAGTGRGDDYGGDEGCLFGWSAGHIWGQWELNQSVIVLGGRRHRFAN